MDENSSTDNATVCIDGINISKCDYDDLCEVAGRELTGTDLVAIAQLTSEFFLSRGGATPGLEQA